MYVYLLQKLEKEEAELMMDDKEDTEEADPRFLVLPRSQAVPYGEPARFTCQVTGTKPLGESEVLNLIMSTCTSIYDL